ncbi:MAG: HNH endonuclease signature motif containing protein [Solirubrobacteraceae bacterium]|jgi:hypothetical protein
MELPFCACGCGQRVRAKASTYLRNHHNRNRAFVEGQDYAVVDMGYETPCHVWLRCTKNGYAWVTRARRTTTAHIVNYERKVGPVPKGKELDHLCRVKHCIREDHLEPVTRAENNRRAQKVRWDRQLGRAA